MKRIFASGLGMTLGLLSQSAVADEVVWRAVKPKPQQPSATQPVAPPAAVRETPAPALTPTTPVFRFQSGADQAAQPLATSAVIDPVGWVRVRGQSEVEDVPPLPKPAAPEKLPNPPETKIDGDARAAPSTLPPLRTAPTATAAAPIVVPCNTGSEPVIVRGPRIQTSAEYLLWIAKGSQVPDLLTTSPPVGANGIPGTVPGSRVLLGGEDLDDATRNGVRIGLTYWLDRCASNGFDGRIFFTGRQTNNTAISSLQPDGTDISLFRPFIAANTFTLGGVQFPGPFVEQVTANGIASGTFTAQSSSYFWGAEANYRDNLWCRSNCTGSLRFDVFAGFRYLHLDEDLTLVENAVRRTPSVDFPDEIVGTRIVLVDQFSTRNDFYGGQIGAMSTYRRDRWTLDLRASVALGATHQKLTIDGSQIRSPLADGSAFVAQGGLLALPNANIGTYTRDVFSVVPEVGLNLGYQVTDHWRAFAGYNFLYWSNVMRPGDQIDPVIDITKVPRFVPPALAGQIQPVYPPRPMALLATTDFWAQGLNLGVEYRW